MPLASDDRHLGAAFDPGSARTAGEFLLLLRGLIDDSGLTYRQLQRRAETHGDTLPPSTLASALKRDTLPRREMLLAVLRACEVPAPLRARWLAACSRIAHAGRVSAAGRASDVDAPEPGRVPRQLPQCTRGFVGRAAELAWLDESTSAEGALAVISGPGGVGKTALAVHWAQAASARFPHGQLYLDLGGFSAHAALTAERAIAILLESLGLPVDDIPADLAARSGLLRSVLADRRMLLILDNAARAEQVRPLVPGGRRCTTLVTSRHQLPGLVVREGARRLDLRVPSPADARALLLAATGGRGEAGELDAIARHCGRLPLALRIAGANLAGGGDPGVFAARLGAESIMDELSVPEDADSDLARVFADTLATVSPPGRALLAAITRFPGTTVSLDAARVLTGETAAGTRRLLAELTAVHLVEQAAPERFAPHDLVRAYASRLSADTAADTRLADWYLRLANAAVGEIRPRRAWVEPPGDSAVADPWRWLDEERGNLAALIRAAAASKAPLAWRLADPFCAYLAARRDLAEWREIAALTLAAAEDPVGVMAMNASLGYALAETDPPASLELCRTALDLARRMGRPRWEANMLLRLGMAHREAGRAEEAVAHLASALEIFGALDPCDKEAAREAAEAVETVFGWYRDAGNDYGEPEPGYALLARTADVAMLQRVAEFFTRLDDHRLAAYMTQAAAYTAAGLGHRAEAASLAVAALREARAGHDRPVEAHALITLATIEPGHGGPRLAAEALDVATRSGDAHAEIRARLALAHLLPGDEALTAAKGAVLAASRARHPALERQAAARTASLLLARGESGEARVWAERAYALAVEAGTEVAVERARWLLGEVG
ncbi:hypothetical protein Afil01_43540 [Actinorhabdospora filicis]|uniref:AAA+ ATPase domain-containing protein n=1 Tax=Actinorhabdospora filicis TaxID=1785913 RepID=A0A9W6SPK8_9ACTN|nr:hypothetical protein [Actinorhabdospora filicis]GLZ79547.1 hypothetical protein Afil01_43540 [Actinorhabdospora filicis]